MTLEGIPFRVCRPMSIPGSFGPALDTLWVFEEEPGSGRVRDEGVRPRGGR